MTLGDLAFPRPGSVLMISFAEKIAALEAEGYANAPARARLAHDIVLKSSMGPDPMEDQLPGADTATPSRHQATHRHAGFVVARSARIFHNISSRDLSCQLV